MSNLTKISDLMSSTNSPPTPNKDATDSDKVFGSRGRLVDYVDPSSEPAAQILKCGYAIVRVCDEKKAKELAGGLWNDMADLGTGIERYGPETWSNSNWPQTTHGLLQNQGVAHWRGVCKARLATLPTWEQDIFKGNRVISSFDAVAFARPASQQRTYKGNGFDKDVPQVAEWLHTDQAKAKTQTMHHIQGAFALVDIDASMQRTQLVIPKEGEWLQSSRDRFIAAFPPEPPVKGRFDPEREEWVKHTTAEKKWLVENGRVIAPELKAGEMLLWDSGVPHASVPGPLLPGQAERGVRMSVFVSAHPIALINSPHDLRLRRKMLEDGVTSGHRVTTTGKTKAKPYLPCKFDETGRTYGKDLPTFSKNHRVSDYAENWERKQRQQEHDPVAAGIAEMCGGYGHEL